MLARLLWIVLAVETAIYVAVGYFLLHFKGWSVFSVLLLVLACALIVRAIIAADMFIVTWVHRAVRLKEMQIGPVATLRLLLAEYTWLVVIYTFLHPFQRWVVAPDPKPGPHHGPPILLVHGYFCNGAYWWKFRRDLRRAGYSQTYTLNLEPVFGRIQDYAEQVGKRVSAVREATGSEQVVLIGHSMGGVVARAWVSEPKHAQQVAQVIALGSPFYGTAHADVALGENARQMKRFNAWLNEQNSAPPPETDFVSIYSYHDNLVAPQDSSHLNFATNYPLAGIGHLELAYCAEVLAIVVDCLSDRTVRSITTA